MVLVYRRVAPGSSKSSILPNQKQAIQQMHMSSHRGLRFHSPGLELGPESV